MQFNKRFLLCAVVAVAWLLTVPAVMGAEPPTSCTTDNGNWTITLVSGPTAKSNCATPSGSCVTATYEVEGVTIPDHVAGLMPLALYDVTGTNVSGSQVYAPAVGDPIFELGSGDISRKAFKVNPNDTVVSYTVWLDGASFGNGLVPVKIKKGSKGKDEIEGACALKGPVELGANLYETFVEEEQQALLGGKCIVKASTDRTTGVTTVELTPGSKNRGCTLEKINLGDAFFQVGNEGGPVLFSEGVSVTVGTGTCTLKQYYKNWGPFYWVCCNAPNCQ